MPGLLLDPILRTARFAGRFPKPSFQYYQSKEISIPATQYAPNYFLIGGKLYSSTENIYCNLAVSGLGGMALGNVEASTIYYLYAVVSEGRVYSVASKISPLEGGVTGYGAASYIGAFPTVALSEMPHFISFGGRLALTYDRIEQVTHTGTTSWTSKTLSTPLTLKVALGMITYTGATANTAGHAAGSTLGTVNYPYGVRLQVANFEMHAYFEIPLQSANTIYLFTSNSGNTVTWRSIGWIEDPSEFV